ncbi:MAG: hypothetical protein IJU76_02715 [Desulfovibrionaceae bacterium]|nr:hypothetical protein [Desulfovibrionaceae bacterium]
MRKRNTSKKARHGVSQLAGDFFVLHPVNLRARVDLEMTKKHGCTETGYPAIQLSEYQGIRVSKRFAAHPLIDVSVLQLTVHGPDERLPLSPCFSGIAQFAQKERSLALYLASQKAKDGARADTQSEKKRKPSTDHHCPTIFAWYSILALYKIP